MKKNFLSRFTALALTSSFVFLAGCGSSQFSTGSTSSVSGTSSSSSVQSSSASAQVKSGKAREGTLRVGSKDFTENEIVAEIYALALEDAGFKVERTFDISSSLIHTSLISDDIDVYPEYTGTGLISILKEDPITDPQQVYDEVKKQYASKFDVTWLNYAPGTDGQGLFISKKVSDEYGITTISDLQKHASELNFASQGEFDQREDGLPRLNEVYGTFNFKSTKVYDNSLKYQVVSSGEADVAPAYTTEGALSETDKFVLLKDDKQAWPPYNLAPVIRNDALKLNPKAEEVLNSVDEKLTTEVLTKLNAEVDIDKKEYEDVAKEFYDSIS
ncbi:MAG: glycine betaine ABC transporter substrate-binding protein [Bilifractor sp.]